GAGCFGCRPDGGCRRCSIKGYQDGEGLGHHGGSITRLDDQTLLRGAELTLQGSPGTLRRVLRLWRALITGAIFVNLTPGGPGLDLRAIVALVSRRRWVILATTVVVFGASALYVLRQPKVYGATTSVVIDAAPPRFLDSQVQDVSEPGAGGYWFTREYTETQTRIITSRAVAQRAVEKLGLQHDPSFAG